MWSPLAEGYQGRARRGVIESGDGSCHGFGIATFPLSQSTSSLPPGQSLQNIALIAD